MRDLCGGVLILAFIGLAVVQATSRERMTVDDARLKAFAATKTVASPVQPGDWPAWRGPLRDGIAAESISESWPEAGPAKLWEQPTGEGYASVAVADGSVYAFFQSGSEETLVAYDRRTGREFWRYSYPALYTNSYGNGPRSTPTVDGERVTIVGGTGLLHCVNAKTGQKLWSRDLLAEFDAAAPKWGISFSPLIDGARLIVHPGGRKGSVVALDKRSGAVLWTSLSEGGGYSSPILADLAGEKQIVAFTAAGLVGLNRDDGKLLWRFPWKTSWDCNIATPIVTGDYVFITSGYDRGCALVKIAKSADAWSAERVFENTKLCSHFASCVRFGDTVYGFNESTLVAMDLRSGKILWRERGFGKGSVLGVGNRLLVLGENGACVLAEIAPKFKELARFSFSDERCWSVPVAAHGLLYLRDQKTLACFDVTK